MKKILIVFLMIIIAGCSACGAEKTPDIEPQVAQMRSICELATMDCYYHNVAKYSEEDAEGFLWWKKDMRFWIEYSGVVTIGIDASLVKIEVAEEEVTITLPPAKVLSCKVDDTTLSKDSFIIASDSAKVDAESEQAAFKETQDKMKEEAAGNKSLLANAQLRAQKLLEDYVNNIGNSVGKQYKIKWIYVDENGNAM